MSVSINLAASLAYASRTYSLRIDPLTTSGTLARYLSQQEAHVSAGTMEVAQPIETGSRLQDLDLRPGDRLVIFSQPPELVQPPDRIRSGDKILTIYNGDYSLRAFGKRDLLIGKPGGHHQIMPDVDIRHFVAQGMLEHVAQECMWLTFDNSQQIWYALKMGKMRILIDEFELGTESIALTTDCTFTFYRAGDSPPLSQPIGRMQIHIEDIGSELEIVSLPPGYYPAPIHLGTERTIQTLNASHNIPIGQIVTSLVIFNETILTENMRVYLMRLVPPNTTIQALQLDSEEFLYVTQQRSYANNLLILRDSHGQHQYQIEAGQVDERRVIGSRQASNYPAISLDVDLSEAIVTHNPNRSAVVPLRQGYIDYHAAENTWTVCVAENTRIPMFVNHVRVTTIPIRLLSGDVLTIGSSMTDYAVRLEIEVSSRLD